MNQKQLHMQPVSSRYLEQYNALLRYVFQVTDQELSSVGWQETVSYTHLWVMGSQEMAGKLLRLGLLD